MKVLLVYAHPVEESFARAIRDTARRALNGAGHAVTDLDLYAEGFAAAVSRAERLDYLDTARNVRHVEPYVAQLQAAEALVLVYPTWWYGLPAILKGWLDRVWLPGVAFTFTDGAIAPGLHNIRKIAVVTTYGAPWWLVKYVGDPGRKLIARGLRRLCAPGTRCLWLAHYRMDASTPASRRRFLAKVERRMARF